MLSDDLKSKHIYLPNVMPDVLGESPLIRIPLAQDPLTYAIHGAVTNAMWSGTATQDGMILDLAATAETILDNLNPIGSGTVLAPIFAVNANKSWFGSRIVPSYLERNSNAADQYTEETPEIFIQAGRMLGMSPMKVQYLAEQYTGFLGQLAIPALSPDNTGEPGGLSAAINSARKRFTSDPLTSNDVVSSFYDISDTINSVLEETKQGKPLNVLRRGLTSDDAAEAYEEAQALNKGIIAETKDRINALYTEIDTINANPDLTDREKYLLTSDKRREMIDAALIANEACAEYREKWVDGSNLITRMLVPGTPSRMYTDIEKLSDTFQTDMNANADYMQKSLEVYNGTGKGAGKNAALPHPSESWVVTTSDGVEHECVIDAAEKAEYDEIYRDAYEAYLIKYDDTWTDLTEDEKYAALKNAGTAANKKMKQAWQAEHDDIFD